ncbi:hypothetical protein FA95DRAFT_1233577 [Auriscalpium vulgare]|uniref:Uncharacterized protein n=1 Tax=Auriscalpium vulgare TaxID=40419 RepID=A0ACB8R2G4_9AGAM|nr:hypothetical protein FA95DRAFT_1233577 [Auriscalpium vulgare]
MVERSCKISAVALTKMVRSIAYRVSKVLKGWAGHPRAFWRAPRDRVPHEIMGLMQGKVVGDSLVIIMDSFALPVQGTETRVNAANEANEYMVQYIQESEKVRRRAFVLSSGRRERCEPSPGDRVVLYAIGTH